MGGPDHCLPLAKPLSTPLPIPRRLACCRWELLEPVAALEALATVASLRADPLPAAAVAVRSQLTVETSAGTRPPDGWAAARSAPAYSAALLHACGQWGEELPGNHVARHLQLVAEAVAAGKLPGRYLAAAVLGSERACGGKLAALPDGVRAAAARALPAVAEAAAAELRPAGAITQAGACAAAAAAVADATAAALALAEAGWQPGLASMGMLAHAVHMCLARAQAQHMQPQRARMGVYLLRLLAAAGAAPGAALGAAGVAGFATQRAQLSFREVAQACAAAVLQQLDGPATADGPSQQQAAASGQAARADVPSVAVTAPSDSSAGAPGAPRSTAAMALDLASALGELSRRHAIAAVGDAAAARGGGSWLLPAGWQQGLVAALRAGLEGLDARQLLAAARAAGQLGLAGVDAELLPALAARVGAGRVTAMSPAQTCHAPLCCLCSPFGLPAAQVVAHQTEWRTRADVGVLAGMAQALADAGQLPSPQLAAAVVEASRRLLAQAPATDRAAALADVAAAVASCPGFQPEPAWLSQLLQAQAAAAPGAEVAALVKAVNALMQLGVQPPEAWVAATFSRVRGTCPAAAPSCWLALPAGVHSAGCPPPLWGACSISHSFLWVPLLPPAAAAGL